MTDGDGDGDRAEAAPDEPGPPREGNGAGEAGAPAGDGDGSTDGSGTERDGHDTESRAAPGSPPKERAETDPGTGTDAEDAGRADTDAEDAASAGAAAPDTVATGDSGTAPESAPRTDPGDVDVEALTGPERSLDPRVRYVWVLGSGVTALVFGTVLGVVGFFVFDEPLVGPVAFTLLFVVGTVLAYLRYGRWSYEVREDSLYLERGVVTHTRTVVPYVRIQHVDASRGPVERAFGLATAVVYTAGSRGADVSIPGLTPERADDLQERLKRLAIAAEGEDAV